MLSRKGARDVPFRTQADVPELPDVAVFKKYLDSTSLHQPIDDVEVADKDVLGTIGPRNLPKRLKGKELVSSRQHGKYLFVETDGAGYLLLHFGMTGFLRYYSKEVERPEHARVLFHFRNGYTLAYDCQRKLGEVDLVESPETLVEEKGLGPDPLHSDFGLRDFRKCFEGRSGTVKSFLMNQRILAGIGNVYSDEILFEAGLNPETPVDELGDDAVEKLYRALRKVLEMAIDRKVDPDRFPDTALLPHRDEGAICPRCGGRIVKETVSGRSAYFCDRHQAG